MHNVTIYYHDPTEVNPATSWTGLFPSLQNANRVNITSVNDPPVTQLFDYARPDAVITVDGVPVVSIEQTQMNPSGHNIPQRFSFHVRSAELNVPSILYYPEYSRRTFSDPNVRYLQIRVPLAQQRLSAIYGIPALSIFWPTDPETLLPDTKQGAHQEMANVVDALVQNAASSSNLLALPAIQQALTKMSEVTLKYASSYSSNASVRRHMPNGFASALLPNNRSIDPPNGAQLRRTEEFLNSLTYSVAEAEWQIISSLLSRRDLTLVYTGTANASRNDSEHPWPGYLTLFDILYTRTSNGKKPQDRDINLIYRLPVNVDTFISRANQSQPPTPTYIVDTFADLILLDGGVVAGRPLRGRQAAKAVLKG